MVCVSLLMPVIRDHQGTWQPFLIRNRAHHPQEELRSLRAVPPVRGGGRTVLSPVHPDPHIKLSQKIFQSPSFSHSDLLPFVEATALGLGLRAALASAQKPLSCLGPCPVKKLSHRGQRSSLRLDTLGVFPCGHPEASAMIFNSSSENEHTQP